MSMPFFSRNPAVFLVLIMLSGVASVQADETLGIPEQLVIGVRGADVRLSWQIPDGYERRFFVFMHTEPITSENLGNAQLIAVLPAGSTQYTEQLNEAGDRHFAVVGETDDREPSAVLVPGRNTTQRAVRITLLPPDLPSAPAPPPPQAEILSLRAITQGTEVRLAVRTTRDDMNVTILRTLDRPDTGSPDHSRIHVVGSAEGTNIQLTDTLVPGIRVYYTAVDASAFPDGPLPSLVPGVNTVRSAVSVQGTGLPRVFPDRSSVQVPSRREPLPGARTDLGVRSEQPVQATPLNEATQEALSRMLSRFDGSAPMRVVRPDPLPTPGEADEIADEYLRQVVGTWIVNRQTDEAMTRLRYLLSYRADAPALSTARFFLGRAEFARGEYREALYQFLLTDSEYASARNIWIRLALDAIFTND